MVEMLSGLDISYLTYTGGPTPMNTAGLVVLGSDDQGGTLTVGRITDLLAERLHLLPRYRQLATPLPLQAGYVWLDDPQFDLGYHVRHHRLPPPGGDTELAALAGRLHAVRLDSNRPLWQAHAIEGLSNGRSAILMLWQHAMVDGMSGLEVARVLFDQSPERVRLGPQPWQPQPSPPVRELVGEALVERANTKLAVSIEAIGDLLDRASGIDRAARFLDGWSAQLDATTGPRWFREKSPLPVRFGIRALDERPLRRIAKSVGAGIDHVVLAMAAGGISDLLAARGQLDQGDVIRTVVPVAVPRRLRRQVLGNHAAYYVMPLPIGAMPAIDRLQAIVKGAAAVRSGAQVAAITTMLDAMNRLPIGSIAAATRSVSGSGAVDLVVSYMRGSRQPQWTAGLPNLSTHPMLPVGPFIRLMVGAVSLAGVLGLGVTADQAAVPELDFLLDRMVRTAGQLTQAEVALNA